MYVSFWKRVLFGVCIIISVLLSNSSFAQSSDEKLVAEAIEELRLLMEKPDSARLAKLASDDLEYVHSSGTVRDKEGFINEFIRGQTRMSNVKILNQTIRIVGVNAIVRHRLLADFHVAGYPPHIDIIILMVWKKEGSEWKLLARQAAKIPEVK